MRFSDLQKRFFGSIHEIMSASTMYMHINKPGRDIIALRIDFDGLRKFYVFLGDRSDGVASDENGSLRNNSARSYDFTIIYFQMFRCHIIQILGMPVKPIPTQNFTGIAYLSDIDPTQEVCIPKPHILKLTLYLFPFPL